MGLSEVFDRRLRELDDKAKSLLGEALKKNSEPAVVCSTFDLPAAQQAEIQNALNETFSAEIRVRFETAPELVSGIELTANGQKVPEIAITRFFELKANSTFERAGQTGTKGQCQARTPSRCPG